MIIQKIKLNQKGFSLVELMVAMVLGLVLIGGVIQVVISNIQTFKMNTGVARVQENARFAMAELSKGFREVGFKGCLSKDPVLTNSAAGIFDLSSQDILVNTIAAGTTSFTVGDTVIDDVIANTQAITIKTLVDVGTKLTAQATGSALTVNSSADIAKDDVLFIGDCEKSQIVDVASVAAGSVTLADTLAGSFNPDALIFKVQVITYYIGETSNYTSPVAVSSLKRIVNGGASEELVVGVEKLEFLFGKDTVPNDGSLAPDQFILPTALGADTRNISVIRVRVKTTSIDPVSAGVPLKRDFTLSVSLRNRYTTGAS